MPLKGYKQTEEHKENMSKALKGKKTWMKGKKHTEKSKRKMRGKKHTKETKRKIGVASKLRFQSKKFKKEWYQQFKKRNSESHKGNKNPNWRGGMARGAYPYEFNKELKLIIRQRDNFTCILCGRTEQEELKEFRQVLTINHIDFNKNNCNENNLNTLCLRCNIKINFKRDYWMNYFKKNYVTN